MFLVSLSELPKLDLVCFQAKNLIMSTCCMSVAVAMVQRMLSMASLVLIAQVVL